MLGRANRSGRLGKLLHNLDAARRELPQRGNPSGSPYHGWTDIRSDNRSIRRHVCNRILFPFLLACGAMALTGCGGSKSQPYNPPVAPPGTAFSNATLDGTYVVSFSGTDISGAYVGFFAVAGTLTTDGAGAITSGTLDLIDPALGSALGTGYTFSRLPVSGTYTVTADGRGSGTFERIADTLE